MSKDILELGITIDEATKIGERASAKVNRELRELGVYEKKNFTAGDVFKILEAYKEITNTMSEAENYNEWLRMLKGMLLSTGYFNDDLTLHKESWKPFFDDGYTPYQAVQIDFVGKPNPKFGEAIPVSIYWETFLPESES